MTAEFEKAVARAREARRSGRLSDALKDYSLAASLARDASKNDLLAFALRHLGDLQQELGNFMEADEVIVEAVALCRLLNEDHPLNLANALRVHALVHEGLGETSRAIESWQEAHGLYTKSRVNEGVQECQNHLNTLRSVC
ncbi:MAG: tetratricopeptide repeat protein [Acidobacteria bacterium]|nr:tetratricopeptide repeat protein [Acidobacteriota bacterium]MBI3488161.1 tetratricopeptide repeat protein [Acidobacteriota bacterium]